MEFSKKSRRDFLKVSASAGGGLMIGFSIVSCSEEEKWPEFEQEINAYIIINGDGSATLMSKNPDIGQGSKTALPMILAEELDMDWRRVNVEQAPLDDRMSPQYAGGSSGIPRNYETMRKAGAAARFALVSAAANLWNVDFKDCSTENGFIYHGKNKVHYGQVAIEAAKIELPEEVELKNESDFRIIGKSHKDVDLLSIVTGKQEYGLDHEIEGMVYASVIKPEVFGSKVIDFNADEAKQYPGVIEIFKIEGLDNPTMLLDSVVVVAENIWSAFKAKKLVEVKWEFPKDYVKSMDDMNNRLDKALKKRGTELRRDGNVEKEFLIGDLNEATYRVPFISHSQMEPINFIADVKNDSVQLIGPTQTPPTARRYASELTGIPIENISMTFTRIGGGFGRRLLNDYSNEVVVISQRISRPVKLVWEREDDFLGDYFRPAGVYHFKARLEKESITAFEVNISSTSRYAYRKSDSAPSGSEAFKDQQPASMVPNYRITYEPIESNVPVGALRTPGVNATTFAYQSFLDELAVKSGLNAIDFHLNLIGEEDRDIVYDDHPGPSYNTKRLKEVIKLVREKSNWDAPSEQGWYKGFAGQYVFGTYVAQVAEVSLQNGRLQIHKVWAVADCGRVINPIAAEAQIQGGITDGISAALYEKIDIQDGKLVQRNFDTYRKLRIKDSPEVEVHFIDNGENPAGLGEPSYPVIFPALCNAIYAATGTRIRELPISKWIDV